MNSFVISGAPTLCGTYEFRTDRRDGLSPLIDGRRPHASQAADVVGARL
jgi:hypothetical protein